MRSPHPLVRKLSALRVFEQRGKCRADIPVCQFGAFSNAPFPARRDPSLHSPHGAGKPREPADRNVCPTFLLDEFEAGY